MKPKYYLFIIAITFACLCLHLPALSQSVSGSGKSAAPIQTQETEFANVVAELTECKRKEGVLTIKVTFRNTGNDGLQVNVDTDHGKYEKIYVTAASKKYFVLKDAEGVVLAPKYINSHVGKDGKILWWAKFPAPPTDVKKINLMMPKVFPFEDVPVKDE
jgi:hypothetical protein